MFVFDFVEYWNNGKGVDWARKIVNNVPNNQALEEGHIALMAGFEPMDSETAHAEFNRIREMLKSDKLEKPLTYEYLNRALEMASKEELPLMWDLGDDYLRFAKPWFVFSFVFKNNLALVDKDSLLHNALKADFKADMWASELFPPLNKVKYVRPLMKEGVQDIRDHLNRGESNFEDEWLTTTKIEGRFIEAILRLQDRSLNQFHNDVKYAYRLMDVWEYQDLAMSEVGERRAHVLMYQYLFIMLWNTDYRYIPKVGPLGDYKNSSYPIGVTRHMRKLRGLLNSRRIGFNEVVLQSFIPTKPLSTYIPKSLEKQRFQDITQLLNIARPVELKDIDFDF